MIKLYDYDKWEEWAGASEGSGASEKIWLAKPKYQKKGVFKFPKNNPVNNSYTSEFISESLAYQIGRKLNIAIAKVDIGYREGRIGCMSHSFLSDNELILHGVDFITLKYPDFKTEILYDPVQEEYYSFEMITESLAEIFRGEDFYIVLSNIIIMMFFDMLIGNKDRHQNNWGIIANKYDENIRFTPLYDNGSSLCAYITEDKIEKYIGKDEQKFISLVDGKSTSRIRIDSKIKKEPKHSDVMRFLFDNYRTQSEVIVPNICNNISLRWIKKALDLYPVEILSENKRILIEKFLIRKVEILKSIFE